MEINKVYCLFEQSGTFKTAFHKLGVQAEDFDIRNDFGETENQIDLFAEIDNAFEGKESIFDGIGETDLILAFFPCTRFQSYNACNFQGKNASMKEWSDEQKLEYSMKLHDELHLLYTELCKLFLISIRGGYRMIVENPYMQPHYLTMFFPIEPKVIIRNRHDEGDYFTKPTQFFFVNCEPEQNVVLQPIAHVDLIRHDTATHIEGNQSRQIKRSLIHPQFAERFIKTYVLSKEGNIWI